MPRCTRMSRRIRLFSAAHPLLRRRLAPSSGDGQPGSIASRHRCLVQIDENIRGMDVSSSSRPRVRSTNTYELCSMMDAFRARPRAYHGRLPYYATPQDRRTSRVPISAKAGGQPESGLSPTGPRGPANRNSVVLRIRPITSSRLRSSSHLSRSVRQVRSCRRTPGADGPGPTQAPRRAWRSSASGQLGNGAAEGERHRRHQRPHLRPAGRHHRTAVTI